MTTNYVMSTIQNTDDANFRLWGKQISDQLKAVGLVQTADTGQINWATVLRPALNVVAGYEIFRFPDTDPLQATAPVFIKIFYGSGSQVVFPYLMVQTGEGSNGSGTLTGRLSSGVSAVSRAAAPLTASYPSYACFKPEIGYLGFHGWIGATTTAPQSMLSFSIARPCTDAGAPTDEAVVLYVLASGTYMQSCSSKLTNSMLYVNQRQFSLTPQASAGASSAVGDEISLFRHYCATPRVRNMPGHLSYYKNDLGTFGPFTVSMLGTERTYVPLGDGIIAVSGDAIAAVCLAVLWE